LTYDDWIANWRRRHPRAGGRCAQAAREMAEAFPELRVVQGRVTVPAYRGVTYVKYGPPTPELLALPPVQAPHWWCVAPNGDVLDPSGDQFSKVFAYEPLARAHR